MRTQLVRVPGAVPLARLAAATFAVCMRYRVTGLAAEVGFFALLSLPPLVLGLFGGVGYIGHWLGPDTVSQVTSTIQSYAAQFLTDDSVRQVIVPTVSNVLKQGRFDLISIGFLLSLWSGSRALNVFLDTISIMYGQSGLRGILRTRALSFSLYLVSLLIGVVIFPLVVIGPSLLSRILPEALHFVGVLYWPALVVLTVTSLTSLFHIATPRRSAWHRDVPGAVLALVIWVGSSFVLRVTLNASIGGTSIYGPLAAPIVVLIWLYFLAIAVLIGAALNAASRTLWPVVDRGGARIGAWYHRKVEPTQRPRHERPLTPMPPAMFESDSSVGGPDGAPGEGQPAVADKGEAGDAGRLDSLRGDRLLSGRTHSGELHR